MIYRSERIAVFDRNGRETSSQVNVLSRWPADRSIMVALVTVRTPETTTEYTLRYGPKIRRSQPPHDAPPPRGPWSVDSLDILPVHIEHAEAGMMTEIRVGE